jgi:hypothetical protein
MGGSLLLASCPRRHDLAVQRLGPSPTHRHRSTEKALRKGIPAEECHLPMEQVGALLCEVATLLDAHPEQAAQSGSGRGSFDLGHGHGVRRSAVVRGGAILRHGLHRVERLRPRRRGRIDRAPPSWGEHDAGDVLAARGGQPIGETSEMSPHAIAAKLQFSDLHCTPRPK